MVLRPTKAPSTKIPASAWAATAGNHLQLQLRLPNIDAETLASELSADGKVLSVSAARKHDGCSCKNTHLFEATLPHTPPRPEEEIDITVKQAASGDKEEMVLTVRMPRHKQLPGNGPTSLKITRALPSFGGQAKASTGKQATAEEDASHVATKEDDASRVQRESNQLDKKFKAVLATRDQAGEEIKPDRSEDATSAASAQGANGTVHDNNTYATQNNNTPSTSSA